MIETMFCPWCRLEQSSSHRFCPRCGGPLPAGPLEDPHLSGERTKTFRFFAGIKVDDRDPENAYLRVSCYRKERTFTSPQGSVTIPGHHVRFSIWVGGEAVCVLSLPEAEAGELSKYLVAELNGLGGASRPLDERTETLSP